jgi:hypothetical protein
MLFKEIITVYSENFTKHINTIYAQNAESFNIKSCGICIYTPLGFKGLNISTMQPIGKAPWILNSHTHCCYFYCYYYYYYYYYY